MTDDTMNLQALVGRSADADFLREMIGYAAQRLMGIEVAVSSPPSSPQRTHRRRPRRPAGVGFLETVDEPAKRT